MSELLRLRQGTLEWRAVEGEVLALDNETSTYLALNRTGSVVWAALAEGATRDELVSAVTAAFDVDAETAAHDVDALLAELRRHNLLAEP
jgi:hypothetical protein